MKYSVNFSSPIKGFNRTVGDIADTQLAAKQLRSPIKEMTAFDFNYEELCCIDIALYFFQFSNDKPGSLLNEITDETITALIHKFNPCILKRTTIKNSVFKLLTHKEVRGLCWALDNGITWATIASMAVDVANYMRDMETFHGMSEVEADKMFKHYLYDYHCYYRQFVPYQTNLLLKLKASFVFS